jgi:hypothetical protein
VVLDFVDLQNYLFYGYPKIIAGQTSFKKFPFVAGGQ